MAPDGKEMAPDMESNFSVLPLYRQCAFQMKKAGPKARLSPACKAVYSGRSSLKVRWPEIIVDTML